MRVSLRDYLEMRIAELDQRLTNAIEGRDVRVQMALAAAKEATAKSEKANDERLALLNEFRAQASDESRKYALDAVMEAEFKSMEKRILAAEKVMAGLQGRAVAVAGLGAIGGASLIGFIVKAAGG